MSTTGILNINLSSLNENWQLINQLAPAAECAAVVKANAYGLGAEAVVRSLMGVGCRTFFVATLGEAIELREAISSPCRIFVLGGQAADYWEECQHYRLSPILISMDQVSHWLKKAADSNVEPVIKVDTGMHRMGLSLGDIDKLLDQSDSLLQCSPAYLMSHLACADTPEHPMNKVQLKAFLHSFNKLRVLLPSLQASFANSSGIFLGEAYHFDLLRPGIALYGGNPTPHKLNPMKPVVELCLPIVQVKTIRSGEYVGYGADFCAKVDTQVAIVFGGYADGLFRLLGGRGYGFCRGVPVPIIGRVSMDAIAFDITQIPASEVKPQCDWIEILGPHQTIDELSSFAETIGYEVLTSLGARYNRTYVGGLG